MRALEVHQVLTELHAESGLSHPLGLEKAEVQACAVSPNSEWGETLQPAPSELLPKAASSMRVSATF